MPHAYFVKLGEGGKWEEESLRRGILRLGYDPVPISLMNAAKWSSIAKILQKLHSSPGATARDLNALKWLCAKDEAVWITFSASKLWWCRLDQGPVHEDGAARFRRTLDGWRCTDRNGHDLLLADIPGGLTKTQGFRGTACNVKERDTLHRLLNAIKSPELIALEKARGQLHEAVAAAIQGLHWKDFEILVDLIFRQSGWRRLGILGETVKAVDLELEEPITRERYQVQVKSLASLADYRKAVAQFRGGGYRQLYFVVHTPAPALRNDAPHFRDVNLVLGEELARMITSAGLVDWVMAKAR